MSVRQTRRQAALAASPDAAAKSPATASEAPQVGDGNGAVPQAAASGLAASDAPKENIFLFWPNIIGATSLEMLFR
jgi:CDP-diacylglycerol--inositol 3-phosphatidyltransferase